MDPLTYETLHRNPALLDSLLQQARRERAEAVHRLLVLPVRRLLRMEACSRTASSPANASSSRAAAPA
jgi:hypothetical protein